MQRVAALLLNVVIQDDGCTAIELKYKIGNEIPPHVRERLVTLTKAIEDDIRKHVYEVLGSATEYVIKDMG